MSERLWMGVLTAKTMIRCTDHSAAFIPSCRISPGVLFHPDEWMRCYWKECKELYAFLTSCPPSQTKYS